MRNSGELTWALYREAGKGRNGEKGNGRKNKTYKDLRVFQNAMDSAMKIFQIVMSWMQRMIKSLGR
jgi:hypothetical protein